MRPPSLSLPWFLASALLASCVGAPKGGTDDTATDADADTDTDADSDTDADADADTDTDTDADVDTGDTGEPPTPISGTVSGAVTVLLYTEDESGGRVEVPWESTSCATETGITFPFGSVWVGAYETDTGGVDHYFGSSVVEAPVVGPNPYTLSWSATGTHEARIYASLDLFRDRIVGSADPRGVYPTPIPLVDGEGVVSVDITILAPASAAEAACAGGGGGGGSGGGGGDPGVQLSGDALVTVTYTSGEVSTMLVNLDGSGPVGSSSTIITPAVSGSGAEGPWSFYAPRNLGQVKLVGAWDKNLDRIFAPDDVWGTYISAPDTDGNPITVGNVDLTDMDVQIPLGGTAGVSVVPFVTLSGAVTMNTGGSFDELPAGSSLYVAALTYRPQGAFDIATSSRVYDSTSFVWSELTGQSSKDFSLVVPAGTIVYLWAYVDADVDGLVNEAGEAVASYGVDDNGTLPTGTTPVSGITLPLGYADVGGGD
jgi:hypothetical protein